MTILGGGGTGGFGCGAGVWAAGLLSTGGVGLGGGGGAAGACLAMIAFRTSPGLEIWERSILVLISLESARLADLLDFEAWASLAARK
jgi:hypothetical protein